MQNDDFFSPTIFFSRQVRSLFARYDLFFASLHQHTPTYLHVLPPIPPSWPQKYSPPPSPPEPPQRKPRLHTTSSPPGLLLCPCTSSAPPSCDEPCQPSQNRNLDCYHYARYGLRFARCGLFFARRGLYSPSIVSFSPHIYCIYIYIIYLGAGGHIRVESASLTPTPGPESTCTRATQPQSNST